MKHHRRERLSQVGQVRAVGGSEGFIGREEELGKRNDS